MAILVGEQLRERADCKNDIHLILNVPEYHEWRGAIDCLVCGTPVLPAPTSNPTHD